MPEELPQKQKPRSLVEVFDVAGNREGSPPLNLAHNISVGEAALAEVESPETMTYEPQPPKPNEHDLLARRQEVQQELQDLEPSKRKTRLGKELLSLDKRMYERTKGVLATELVYILNHNRNNPNAQVSSTDEIDAMVESGEKSGYFDFARKLDYIYDMLAAQQKTNKKLLDALYSIEGAVKAVETFNRKP